MNTFTQVWNKMDEDKGITDSGKNIVMNPEQFRKMLRQFYDVGYKHGRKFGKDEGIRTAKNLEDLKNSGSGGKDFFGGEAGDLFDTMFGDSKK